MLVFGTQMHIVTFLIIVFEMLFFFYQIVHFLSRPSDKNRLYYLVLLYLLIQYNIISGLFPNPNYSLSIPLQNITLFATGFIMGMYFPYYFYKAFNLSKLKFYAYWGSVVFLLLPFILFFLIPYYITNDLESSKKLLLVVAFLYAVSFLYSLNHAIKEQSKEQKVLKFKNEIVSVYIGTIFWVALPVISYLEVKTNAFFEPIFHFNDTSQVIEMVVTNAGLLMMTILFIRQSIHQSREEHEKLKDSEIRLQEMNNKLQEMNEKLQQANEDLLLKVAERTKELEIANEQRTNTFINLAHDIKTPLTLINNYLEDYVNENPPTESLKVVQLNIEKLTRNVVNFFDSERIKKGVTIYNHDQIAEFSKILNDNVVLFQKYSLKKAIEIVPSIDNNIFIKADPEALNRIINNVIENAIKYTNEGGQVDVTLKSVGGKIYFSVKDTGIGIAPDLHQKVFDPYYQINSKKANFQGMGLGLSITKKILDGLEGNIQINSDPNVQRGTEVIIQFSRYYVEKGEIISEFKNMVKIHEEVDKLIANDKIHNSDFPTLLVVEDNIQLLNFLSDNLNESYNVYIALSGNDAIEKLKTIKHLDLIISDVMMDDGDGFKLYNYVSEQKRFRHIPFIFLTAKTEDKIQGLAMGAIDYILKPFLIKELIHKVVSVLNNLSEQRRAIIDTIHQSIVSKNESEQSTQPTQDKFEENCIKYSLTPQEKKIVTLIAKGQSQKGIAETLFISDKTVKTHMRNIFDKVLVTSKVELLGKLEIALSNDEGK
jgi:signal transduction histidine kinase/DNA-binding NarL/FixJ family response regulator